MEDSVSKSLLLICLDGHGEFGHKISQCFKKELQAQLFIHAAFGTDVKKAVTEVLSAIECKLLLDPTIETDFSGTTLVLAVIRGHSITIANIGDSRIVLGQKFNEKTVEKTATIGGLKAIRLSIDHKPDIPMEKDRVIQSGGRVFAIEYGDGSKGPERVWLGTTNIPGLAMSRSLCDKVAHSVGVSSVPEFFEINHDPTLDCFLILATDGLWEFVSDQEAADIAANAAEPSVAANALIREATEKWLANEKAVDDISVCVAFLSGYTAGTVSNAPKNCENEASEKAQG